MRASSARQTLAPPTSDEDCECTAAQALLLAMDSQLQPPPPLGEPAGEARWGGAARAGPALCPLVNLVLPPPGAEGAAPSAVDFNAARWVGRARAVWTWPSVA